MIRVLLADDLALVRARYRMILDGSAGHAQAVITAYEVGLVTPGL
jgi:hypothetical protein